MSSRLTTSTRTRPSIPTEVSRAVLVESGYRCAVCGDACPLERAHIVPWRKTHEHKKEDMICLCATCHQRADLENWGETTLREFKTKPWVFRRIMNAEPPQRPKKIEITFQVERASYAKEDERLLLRALASILGIDVTSIKITSIEEGSTKVTIELPGDKADELVSKFEASPDVLQNRLSRYNIASMVHKEEDLRTKLERGRSPRELSPEEYSQLREMLLHSTTSEYSCHIACRLAESLSISKYYKKALFYNRIAEERAGEAGLSNTLATIYNQRGNILLAESFVEEALGFYKKALEKLPESIHRPPVLANAGYCCILLGQKKEGFSYLITALRTLTHLKVTGGVYLLSVHLDLTFAYVDTGRLRYAKRHGEKALRIAKESGESDAEKNALYLLGEIAHLSGDFAEAREYFTILQKKFFPSEIYLPQFLMSEDLKLRRGLIGGRLA
ncbi:MAG TPA: HNH endonuclease [Thermoanaerobaculia bacterium]|nr:HNH endonuclease [Thermoanaerobaculia bacterium]